MNTGVELQRMLRNLNGIDYVDFVNLFELKKDHYAMEKFILLTTDPSSFICSLDERNVETLYDYLIKKSRSYVFEKCNDTSYESRYSS